MLVKLQIMKNYCCYLFCITIFLTQNSKLQFIYHKFKKKLYSPVNKNARRFLTLNNLNELHFLNCQLVQQKTPLRFYIPISVCVFVLLWVRFRFLDIPPFKK